MAEPISIQQLKDASEDAITLADFIYKPANVMIPRRLAADINSLQYYLDYMSSYAQHSYETYDEMVANAVNLPENVSAFVTNDLDTAKNGIYTYNGVSFVKGDYQPEKAAKDFVEAKLDTLPPFEDKRLADTFVTATAYGSGSIARTQREINAERVSVHDFGAIGDGTLHTVAEWIPSRFTNLAAIQAAYPKVTALTDSIDGTAIQACIDYCTADGKLANSVMGRRYVFNKQLRITCPVDFNKSTFEVVNTFNDKFIVIDSGDVGKNFYVNIEMRLPVVLMGSPFGARPLNSSGVYIDGMRNCTVHFDTINGFYNNLHLYSNDTNKYISYNDFHFHGSISGGASNVLIEVEGSGWINQCQWFGGQFGTFGPDVTNHQAVCIRIKKTFGGNNGPNGHTFIGCSMEGSFYRTISYDFDPLIITTYFSSNRWVACRFEASKVFQFNPAALQDSFIGCMVAPNTTFVDKITPNMIDCTRMSRQTIDVGTLIGVDRESVNTHFFAATNSSGAMALSVGIAGRTNAGITSGGTVAVFNPSTDMSIKHPVAKVFSQFGMGAIAFGEGAADASERLYYAGVKDWRHDASISPALDNDVDLGKPTLQYRKIYSVQNRMKEGFGVWGSVSPASRPIVSGVSGDAVTLYTLLNALKLYGLIDNQTTLPPAVKGITTSRPSTAKYVGQLYLDTTLAPNGKPIWWNGSVWVDALGVVA